MKIFVCILLAATTLSGCTNDKNRSKADLNTYDGLSAALQRGDKFALYDVRTAQEFSSGHIPGAKNIPHDKIAKTIPVKEKDTVIVLYCRSGARSGVAKRALTSLGYTNIVDFGGITKWRGDLETGGSE